MAKYNRALDLVGLALQEQAKGNKVNASALLAMAVRDPSVKKALDMIEATNKLAVEAQTKERATAPVQAAPLPQVTAGAFEPTDDATSKVLAQSVKPVEASATQAPVETNASAQEVDAQTLKLAKALAKALAETK